MRQKAWLTLDDQPALLRWAAERIGKRNGWVADSEAVGVLEGEEGRIVAVAVFNHFEADGCSAHFASDGRMRWRDRDVMAGLFYYPFVHRSLRRLTARIAVDNIAAQVNVLMIGFSVEGRERRETGVSDFARYGMLREECRWIKEG